jgi:hypothetical protein
MQAQYFSCSTLHYGHGGFFHLHGTLPKPVITVCYDNQISHIAIEGYRENPMPLLFQLDNKKS